ncbi:type VI secretion system lipoprotein TssJ [Paraburkholderia domus]|nr:type VI secretion system lipoprotein TssJ [Paraburkholderia domus]MBK5169361.1 type VI secretion system lipoprotein TssJ [Burkholderia sp. R-70211]
MRLITSVTAVAFALSLAACASGDPKPKEPLRLDVTMNAAATVNPDGQKRAAPIIVRVYELKTDGAFNAADFFTLQDKDKTVLADDLVKRDQFQLRPGEQVAITRTADPATTALGILASYRDLPNSVWRAVYALPVTTDKAWYRFSTPKLKLTITLDANAIKVTEAPK